MRLLHAFSAVPAGHGVHRLRERRSAVLRVRCSEAMTTTTTKSKSPTSHERMVAVRFMVPFKAEFGESLRVVGNHESMGSWDVSAAPRMEWSEGDTWVAAVAVPDGTALEYKIVYESSGGLQWEQVHNRVVHVDASGAETASEATDGSSAAAGVVDVMCSFNEATAVVVPRTLDVKELRQQLPGGVDLPLDPLLLPALSEEKEWKRLAEEEEELQEGGAAEPEDAGAVQHSAGMAAEQRQAVEDTLEAMLAASGEGPTAAAAANVASAGAAADCSAGVVLSHAVQGSPVHSSPSVAVAAHVANSEGRVDGQGSEPGAAAVSQHTEPTAAGQTAAAVGVAHATTQQDGSPAAATAASVEGIAWLVEAKSTGASPGAAGGSSRPSPTAAAPSASTYPGAGGGAEPPMALEGIAWVLETDSASAGAATVAAAGEPELPSNAQGITWLLEADHASLSSLSSPSSSTETEEPLATRRSQSEGLAWLADAEESSLARATGAGGVDATPAAQGGVREEDGKQVTAEGGAPVEEALVTATVQEAAAGKVQEEEVAAADEVQEEGTGQGGAAETVAAETVAAETVAAETVVQAVEVEEQPAAVEEVAEPTAAATAAAEATGKQSQQPTTEAGEAGGDLSAAYLALAQQQAAEAAAGAASAAGQQQEKEAVVAAEEVAVAGEAAVHQLEDKEEEVALLEEEEEEEAAAGQVAVHQLEDKEDKEQEEEEAAVAVAAGARQAGVLKEVCDGVTVEEDPSGITFHF